MRKILMSLIAIISLVSCAPEPGHEGGPCYEDGTCIWEVLACGPDNICHFCGDPEELCCEGDPCHDCCICGSDGLCHVCGYTNNPCCEGDLCKDGSECGSDGICRLCGGEGGPCCKGSVCTEWTYCGSDGLCHLCGYNDNPCCEGNICAEGYFCDSENVCHHCGGYNQACCEGEVCDQGLICGWDTLCHSCGSYDQLCCEGNTCDEGYECGEDGICHSCGSYLPCEGNVCDEGFYYDDNDGICHLYGHLGNRCSEGDTCDGWYECLNGICVNPFKVDKSRSEALCEEAERGNFQSNRDWCYWYAAYLKEEPSICENITWNEMKEKCLDGRNPANYYVLPSF